jgi:hypothetical protein
MLNTSEGYIRKIIKKASAKKSRKITLKKELKNKKYFYSKGYV